PPQPNQISPAGMLPDENVQLVHVETLDDKDIVPVYTELLDSRAGFYVIENNGAYYILTKEKSFFEIDNLQEFIEQSKQDIYFKTILDDKTNPLPDEDLNLYYRYLEGNRSRMPIVEAGSHTYIFGSVAVKTTDGRMITTTRGKNDLTKYAIVSGVDFNNHIVYADKKATLNAPLLYRLIGMKGVKAVVHTHDFDEALLPYLPYAFPGTVRDSLRDVKGSFNISHHGVFELFDNNGKIIKGSL
ncbi:class II aldolase/adducin family protein, partial [Candidatus Saccharibacteria bacterium]|nr:class II aldolase/adducin family protein [Candidatus Saccharibacteria bacterium]